ncbi:HAD hydrolase-like protein [Flexibacterium corallicola]|uniref:HAD hydrolase-like protein n=1 Tax=Flexibacterium corallicola TaxID=3037259 RepID=UPI00286F41E6|nr:HAD hydrolase-like protein [Pseudovibrio sp. M1P-2-3]
MKSLLFDLDGTLTNPFTGITSSIQYAMNKLGHPHVDARDLHFTIGPPLSESFSILLDSQDEKRIQKAITLYRERYANIGLYENEVYEGIPELLQGLKSEGYRMLLCTSKPRVFAEKILKYFTLTQYFTRIYGCELDGTFGHKPDLLRHIIEQEALIPQNAVMIGDRKHDLLAARENNVAAIGVSWGFGSVEELRYHKAEVIVDSPKTLGEVIGQPFSAAPA